MLKDAQRVYQAFKDIKVARGGAGHYVHRPSVEEIKTVRELTCVGLHAIVRVRRLYILQQQAELADDLTEVKLVLSELIEELI